MVAMACPVPRNRLAKWWTFHRPDLQAHRTNYPQTSTSCIPVVDRLGFEPGHANGPTQDLSDPCSAPH